MAQFASVADLTGFLGRDIEEPRATLLLELASAAIQTECHQQLEYVTGDTIQLHPQQPPDRYTIQLPQIPVTAVSSVLIVLSGATPPAALRVTNYEFTRYGRVRWPLGEFTGVLSALINAPIIEPDYPPQIIVTYDHGYQEIPDIIRAVTITLVARMLANPEAVESVTIGTFKQSFGGAGAALASVASAVELSGGERRMLEKFRLKAHQ